MLLVSAPPSLCGSRGSGDHTVIGRRFLPGCPDRESRALPWLRSAVALTFHTMSTRRYAIFFWESCGIPRCCSFLAAMFGLRTEKECRWAGVFMFSVRIPVIVRNSWNDESKRSELALGRAD